MSRQLGNEAFTRASGVGLPNSVRIYRFQEALRHYTQGYDGAQPETEDRVFCARNAAVACIKIVRCSSQEPLHSQVYWIREGLTFVTKANDQLCGIEWAAKVDKTFDELEACVYSIIASLESPRHRASFAFHIIPEMTAWPMKAAELCFFVAETHLKAALESRRNEDYNEALWHLAECYRPLIEGKSLACKSGSTPHRLQACSIEDDLKNEEACCRSMRERAHADALYETLAHSDGAAHIDVAWDIVDHYRHAILLSEGREVENEAVAFAGIGTVFYKVLNLPAASKQYFHRAVELALTLGIYVQSCAWYQAAAETLEAFQQQASKEADEETRKRRAPILASLSEELQLLEEHQAKGAAEFLAFIYTSFPPKNTDHIQDKAKPRKKQLLTATVHYHPDRISEAFGHDPKWCVLCEEICKILTAFYEEYKHV